jgi:hypothetical protein
MAMTTFSHPHIDRLATQLIEKANLGNIPASDFPILRSLLLKELHDRFDRVLEFSFPLQPWEKMADFEKRRG